MAVRSILRSTRALASEGTDDGSTGRSVDARGSVALVLNYVLSVRCPIRNVVATRYYDHVTRKSKVPSNSTNSRLQFSSTVTSVPTVGMGSLLPCLCIATRLPATITPLDSPATRYYGFQIRRLVVPRMSPRARFMGSTVPDGFTGCWMWQRSTNGTGYPQFSYQGRTVYARRWIYEQVHGGIPEDHEVYMSCATERLCVNPGHMRLVAKQVEPEVPDPVVLPGHE